MRRIYILSLIAAAVFALTGQGSIAQVTGQNFSCGVGPLVAFADGQAQQFTNLGCAAGVNATVGGTRANPTVSTVDAMVNAVVPETITLDEKAKGNADIEIGATESDTITGRIPALFELALGVNQFLVNVGDITYDLHSESLRIQGTAKATVTNGEEASGARIDFSASAFIPGQSARDSTEVGPCGSSFTVCPGVDSKFLLTLGPFQPFINIIDFRLTMSELILLETEAGLATSTVEIDSVDPFEITTISLLDANGLVIPGVTFSDDSGIVFQSEPSGSTTVPEPSSLALLGTGLAGLGLMRRRRKTA